MLFTEADSQQAIALDSVDFVSGPFDLNTTYNLSSDHRTRIMLFAGNLVLNPGETASLVTVQAQDSQGATYPLTVEFVGDVLGYPNLAEVVVRFPDQLPSGKLWLSISLRGVSSNQAFITIKNVS